MKPAYIQKSTSEITDEQLDKISVFSRRGMNRDEVFIFPLTLCNNVVDRDFERFPLASLKAMSQMFIGMTGIFDHSPKAENQAARIFDTEIVQSGQSTEYGEPFTELKAWAYMVRCNKNVDLILEIDAGIKKEISVGLEVEKQVCCICGRDQKTDSCGHRAGAEYDGKLCYYELVNPTDAFEWSFVAVPAQRGAGVAKRYRTQKEVKHLALKAKKVDSDAGTFEGYAAVFGNVDSDGDIIEPGAFAKFLAGDPSRVKILALHNDKVLPIGVPVELYEDDIGLYLKAQLSDTGMGRDIRQLLIDGVLNELSIGYIPVDFYFDNAGNRCLTEIILEEVSVVTWAANDMAKVLSAKGKKTTEPDALIEIAIKLEEYAAGLRLHAQQLRGDFIAGNPKSKKRQSGSNKSAYCLPGTLSGKSR